MAENKKSEFFTYKGRPLVRNKDTLYYGDMSDNYVIMMQITESSFFSYARLIRVFYYLFQL